VTTQAQNNNAKELAAEETRIIYWTIAFNNFRIPHIQRRKCEYRQPGRQRVCKNPTGNIFHTYSIFARGLDILVGAYNFLDFTPKGRDEDGLAFLYVMGSTS
jgi:predicted dithiol-disulfide oxidoreductase (DUF899 family)